MKDGLTALQKGLVPALWFQWVMNGTRLGLYHLGDENGLTKKKNGDVAMIGSMVTASCAGAISGVISSPLFLVKEPTDIIKALKHLQ
jgi:solute carrier family 25 protein 34/35